MHESTMTVRLIGKLEDGTVFDRRGHDGEEPLEFTIDEGYTILAVYANCSLTDGPVSCHQLLNNETCRACYIWPRRSCDDYA
jgi:hypothetical protein